MTALHEWTRSDYLGLALWFFPAAVVTWGFHEAAHWAAGELLGYEMWVTFNSAGLVEGTYRSTFDRFLVDMAGPLVTWTQGILAFVLIRNTGQVRFYAFLFLALWMRAVAMGLSYASQPNDEARASLALGLPMWVLPAASVAFLLVLTYQGSRHLRAGWRGNALSYVMASIVLISVVTLNGTVF